MTSESFAPVVVCILPEELPNASRTVSYTTYIHEILRHAGLCYSAVSPYELAKARHQMSILLTIGEYPLPEPLLIALRDWVTGGGHWIAVGGVGGAADLFGVTLEPPAYRGFGGGGANNLGEGYLQPQVASRLLEHVSLPLHFFNGLPVQATDATVLAMVLDKHQRTTSRVALTTKAVGQGRCTLLTPDLTGTIVRIQQGLSVTRDGVSAPDGSAPVGDNVLKSGDGAVLDWSFDRQPVPGVTGLQAFLQPIADLWRELLLRTLFDALESADVALPLLWLYPQNRPALAHLSHDTDGNDPVLGERLLEVVGEAGIPSTWCVIVPGYPPELMERIKAAGHELAMHYDAMSADCPWSHTLFHEQWETLVSLFGAAPVSNKNHYLRWEGDVDFFHWCEEHGIQLDQSKGASKTGEAGYNFGTCHVAFPVTFEGATLDVLELPTPTQDLEIFAPRALVGPLLDATLRSHGILHLLFHPAHIAKPGVADALLTAVATAQAQGMVWWSAAAINGWERARRQSTWQWQASADGTAAVTLHTAMALPAATILWRCRPAQQIILDHDAPAVTPVRRWGFDFYAVQVDLAAAGVTQWRCG